MILRSYTLNVPRISLFRLCFSTYLPLFSPHFFCLYFSSLFISLAWSITSTKTFRSLFNQVAISSFAKNRVTFVKRPGTMRNGASVPSLFPIELSNRSSFRLFRCCFRSPLMNSRSSAIPHSGWEMWWNVRTVFFYLFLSLSLFLSFASWPVATHTIFCPFLSFFSWRTWNVFGWSCLYYFTCAHE